MRFLYLRKVELLSEVDGVLGGELSVGSMISPGLNMPRHSTTCTDIFGILKAESKL